jgi:hypothetical protein
MDARQRALDMLKDNRGGPGCGDLPPKIARLGRMVAQCTVLVQKERAGGLLFPQLVVG